MATGFGLLRLSPAAFWAMTPVEFDHAMRAHSPAHDRAPLRADLAALMSAFPDALDKES